MPQARWSDLLHAMQFRSAQVVQVSGMCPASRPSRTDRDCPLDTARDRCLWHVGGTAGTNDGSRAWRQRLQLDQRVRPVPGGHFIVGKSRRGSRHPSAKIQTLAHLVMCCSSPLGRSADLYFFANQVCYGGRPLRLSAWGGRLKPLAQVSHTIC
jgi:hypothetical protein